MARLRRDNGGYEDTTTKKILSPYPDDRSAVTDCRKLAASGFGKRRAVLIYGFEDPARPIMWLIDAFELIAKRAVTLGPRETAPLNNLVHPVFAAGHVWAWEVLDSRSDSNVPTHEAKPGSCRHRTIGQATAPTTHAPARADKEEVRGSSPPRPTTQTPTLDPRSAGLAITIKRPIPGRRDIFSRSGYVRGAQ